MNADDPVRELAVLIARRRAWTVDSVLEAFRDTRVRDRPFWAVLVASGRCYADPATSSPRRLCENGWWWRETGPTRTPGTWRPPPRPENAAEITERGAAQVRAVLRAQQDSKEIAA